MTLARPAQVRLQSSACTCTRDHAHTLRPWNCPQHGKYASGVEKCPDCGGYGRVAVEHDGEHDIADCPTCWPVSA